MAPVKAKGGIPITTILMIPIIKAQVKASTGPSITAHTILMR
jgi:hypothetical protein